MSMSISHVSVHCLLSAYLEANYNGKDILAIYMDDLMECCDRPEYANFMSQLAGIFGGRLPSAFILPGFCIIEMSEPAIRKILIDFNKAPFRLEQYHGGQCISENR